MTEAERLIRVMQECGWMVAISTWRDPARFATCYELQDLNKRHVLLRVDDMMLARAYHPDDIIYDTVLKLVHHYFDKELKQPEAFRAVRLLTEARRQLDPQPVRP